MIAETLRNSEDSRARVSNRFCPWRADVDLRARGGVKGAAVSLRRPHEVDPGERRVGLAEGDEGPKLKGSRAARDRSFRTFQIRVRSVFSEKRIFF